MEPIYHAHYHVKIGAGGGYTEDYAYATRDEADAVAAGYTAHFTVLADIDNPVDRQGIAQFAPGRDWGAVVQACHGPCSEWYDMAMAEAERVERQGMGR